MSRPRFVPGVRLADEPHAEAWVFAFRERKLLIHEEDGRPPRRAELAESGERRLHLGTLDGRDVLALELDAETQAPGGMAFRGLRGVLASFDDTLAQLAGRAIQIVDWDRDHQFCGRCASPTEDHPTERSKRCPSCGLTHYPRLAPAVIVLVERGEEILLARSPHFVPGVYSTLAGFVEPGETLEEAVVREIEEEVGVTVGDIRYFGSQPWPFPNSLMIGFTARYLSGEIVLDEEEIEDAGWFTAGSLPRMPSRISIARRLIEAFLARG